MSSPTGRRIIFICRPGKSADFPGLPFYDVKSRRSRCTFLVQRLLLFAMIRFYHSSYSPSAFLAAATRLRLNMLSTTAQYLSARQTMMASRQLGT